MLAYENRTPDVTLAKFKYHERQIYPNRLLKCSQTLSILQCIVLYVLAVYLVDNILLATVQQLCKVSWSSASFQISIALPRTDWLLYSYGRTRNLQTLEWEYKINQSINQSTRKQG